VSVETWRQLYKVLIICEEPSARDTMRVLLGSMGCQCVVAPSVQQAIVVLEQENPDAAIVDPRSPGFSAAPIFSGLDKIYARLSGRVVVLAGQEQEKEQEFKELLERYCIPSVPRNRLLQELWGNLESLFRPKEVLRRLANVARLVFDSFVQPMPAGVRGVSQASSRQLVYQSGSLMADLRIEPQSDFRNFALVGQIADSNKPDRQFDSIPVVLHGPKGPIALSTTNKFGEFQFNFDFEPIFTREIEVPSEPWVSVALPSLEWAQRAVFAGS
jgi:CheY-like chemotaxis protein